MKGCFHQFDPRPAHLQLMTGFRPTSLSNPAFSCIRWGPFALNTALAYILYTWCFGLHETTTGPLCLAERQTPRAVALPGGFIFFLATHNIQQTAMCSNVVQHTVTTVEKILKQVLQLD